MGLLDFPEDPQKQALMMAALGLLGGAPQGRKSFGADLSHAGLLAMQGLQQGRAFQMKQQEEEQQKQMRALQLQQMQRQNEQQGKMDALAPQFFSPGVSPLTPNDDNGNPMPSAPPKSDFGGYANAVAGIDPMRAIAIQQAMAKDTPFSKVDPKDFTADSVKAFMLSGGRDFSLLKPRVKMEAVNTGGATQFVDPYAPPQAVAHTVSPDTQFTGGVTMRGQNMTDAREQQGLKIKGAELAYNTGLGSGNYNFPQPNIPGVDLSGLSPKQAQDAAGNVSQKRGEAVQTAAMNLPDIAAQTKQTIGLVDKLVSHPGFSTSVGAKGPTGALAAVGMPIPGTEAADWKVMRDQLVGQQFMQAYNTLKGGGQITEVEGKKATDAIARMSTTQSEAAFKEAAKEFKLVLQAGLIRAQQKAGGGWSIRPLP